MGRSIVFGIDGTDPFWFNRQARDDAYDKSFTNSFVRKICNGSGYPSKYERGPLIHGGNLVSAINTGIMFIQRELMDDPDLNVLLTGYSRGAAGVIAVAQQLAKSVTFKAMMLFDCVDRSADVDTMLIPDNVQNVRHARRDPLSSSRETMGNSGYTCNRAKTNYEEDFFMCTHAGMGGTPWPLDGHDPMEFIFEEGAAKPKFKIAHADTAWPLPEIQDAGTTITYRQDKWISENKVWPWCQPWLLQQGFMQ